MEEMTLNLMLGLSPLIIPLWSTGFLLTGPHLWWQALLWVLPMGLPVLADYAGWRGGPPVHAPPRYLASAVIGAVAGLFVIDLGLLLEMSTRWRWSLEAGLENTLSDLLAVKFLLGSHGAHSSLLTGHELIHRRSRVANSLGRLLLALSCYHHFSIEHLHGHHRRVGREEDPATARFGETYEAFFRRSVTGQFKSAWKLESQRVHRRPAARLPWLGNKVLRGMIFESCWLVSILWIFGPAALLAYAVQTFMAIRNLEAINYVQHWGLVRNNRPPGAADAWRTDTWCSTHMLLGMAHHARHHQEPARPYFRLRPLAGSPKLPHGYFALMFLIAYRNERFQTLATAELGRLGLGPFSGHGHAHDQIHSQCQPGPQ